MLRSQIDFIELRFFYCKLEAVMDKYLKERQANGQPVPEVKQVSLSINKKIAEITPSTSNILDYERIMKN